MNKLDNCMPFTVTLRQQGLCFAHLFSEKLRGNRTDPRLQAVSPFGSRLAARGSRLKYRTRFLAAPPAGILEQKRDCSQCKPTLINVTS